MTTKNVAASVKARLMQQARETNRPFDELLQYFGLERFLYRISVSEYKERFVLKGALMLRVWEAPLSRPTRDIDLLGRLDNSVANLEEVVRQICLLNIGEDGIVFDSKTVKGSRIKEDADYEGVRVKFTGFLDRTRIPMQIDVGFGDVVYPSPIEQEYPGLLDFGPPKLKMYPRESVVSENFEAIVFLGRINSRIKDFFDIWLLARNFHFNGRDLSSAISKTFAYRKTAIDPNPIGLSDSFVEDVSTKTKYRAFLRKGLNDIAPDDLSVVVATIRRFLLPVAKALANGEIFEKRWIPPGPWID